MDTLYTPVPVKPPAPHSTVQRLKTSSSHIPYFIALVGLVQTVLFLAVDGQSPLFQLLLYSAVHRSQLWRYLSYSLLHLDTTHLIINLFIQTALAVPLEIEQGCFRTASVYVLGVLAGMVCLGSLGTAMMDPELSMVGASAGIYALLLAHLPNIFYNCESMQYKWYRAVSVLCLCAGDVAYDLLRHGGPVISWAAHLSGAAVGILLGLALFISYDNNSPLCMSLFRYAAIILLTILMLFFILYINTYKNKAVLH